MKLASLGMEKLEIPFRVEFQHSSASRASTEAVLVTATDSSGREYLGEGCPRSYVTRETVETALNFFSRVQAEVIALSSVEALQEWCVANMAIIDKNPAAFCAIEMAMLRAFAGTSLQTVESLLQLPELSGEFLYTAVLGTSDPQNFSQQLQHYLAMGFENYKVKLFGEMEVDRRNLQQVQAQLAGPDKLRADANNLWPDADLALDYLEQMELSLFALEEPVGVGDLDACIRIAKKLGVKIILDESLTRLEQLDQLENGPECWIVNLRVSKMGGMLRSLAIVNRARQAGIPIIIGAQVGETSLLTRAALTIANSCRDILIGQEGGFGTYLLERDIVDPPIMFAKGAVIRAEDIKDIVVKYSEM